MADHKDIDGGYAWVVLVISWLLMVISGVVYYSTGVVNTAVLERMGASVVKTSWVGSTLFGTIMLTGPVTSSLTNVLGCRVASFLGGVLILTGMCGSFFATSVDVLIVSYGVITGLGMGLMETSSIVITGHYFKEYLPVAAGIHMSGGGVGMLIGGPLVRYLLDSYGLRGVFLILGAIGSHACVGGLLMRPSAYERKRRESGRSSDDASQNLVGQRINTAAGRRRAFVTYVKAVQHECIELLVNVSFLFYMLSYSLWGFGESAVYVHLTNYVEQKGTSPKQSALLYTAMGITSLLARILSGIAGNDPAVGAFVLHPGMLGIAGVLMMLFPLFSSTYTEQVIFACLYGVYSGGPMSLLNPIIVQLLGVRRLASGYGLLSLIGGIGLLVGPPCAAEKHTVFPALERFGKSFFPEYLAGNFGMNNLSKPFQSWKDGFILDYSGSFDISYMCSGAAVVVSGLVSMPITSFKRRDRETYVCDQNDYPTDGVQSVLISHPGETGPCVHNDLTVTFS